MEDKSESALEFLQNLESRHSQVLDDLDVLNSRIETILDSYLQSRKPESAPKTGDTEAA